MIFVYLHAMTGTWRLLDSGPLPPAESAATDEALLESHADGSAPNTLHFYTRVAPTVSLGYFQRVAEAVDLEECALRGVQLVRRRSGGSAIFTDPGQLIYALVVPSSVLGGGAEGSFAVICEAIARAVSTFGVDARHRPVNDIEVSGRKISGSAQLRRHGSVLQHGTLLIDADIQTMEAVLRDGSPRPSVRVATLSQLTGASPGMDAVKAAIVAELSRSFEGDFEKGVLTDTERARVNELVRTRYGRREWNLRM
jgi:lipoate-protein ligase A